jgi:hypothetical protein
MKSSLRPLICSLVSLICMGGLVPAAQGGEALRWKFTTGEKIGYTIDQSATVVINSAGAEFTIPTQQIVDVTWTVDSVAQDGAAAITQHVDRVRLTFTMPGRGGAAAEFAYDSQEKKEADGTNPIAALLKPVFAALVGADFRMTISPTGRVSDVTIPDAVSRAIGVVPRGAAFAGGNLLTPEGLRQTFENSILALPEAEVEEGGTWTHNIERALPGAGALAFELNYTLKGTDELCDRQTRRIESQATITHRPAPEADGQITIESVEGKGEGTAHFDPAAGRTVRSVLKVSLIIDGNAGDREFTQENDLTITVTLAGCEPAAEKPAAEKPAAEKPAE